MNKLSIRRTLLAAPLLSILILGSGAAQAQNRKGGPALKHAEAVLGKPLSPAQKKAVKAAIATRQEAIKPIQDKYKATVAKALGLTVAQFEEREKKIRQNNQKGE